MLNEAIYIYVAIIVFLASIFFIYKKQNKDNSQISLPPGTIAVFRKKYADGITLILSGFFLIVLFVFIGYKDSEATLGGLLVGIVGGVVSCFFGITSLLFNHKAFLYIDNCHIKGKYYLFSKIDCNLSDVVFSLGRNGTLIIQLKDGKTHTIMGIENAWELGLFIRKNITFNASEQPESLIENLNNLKTERKKGIVYVCCGLALMFINIFITVFLTGEREMYEFSKIDWIIFAVMCVVEFATVFTTFYFVNKIGKKNVPIEKLNYDIRRTVIETKPLVYGYIIKVFTDYDCTGRIVVLGYPDDESVYYIMQEFASDYSLFKSYESEIYENMDDLLVDIGELIDITDKFN